MRAGLPSTCPFAPNHAGAEDVAIFDFSKKQQSLTPFKIFGEQEGNKLLVALVGDALIEPFWPLGTGANRAILSALDTTWMVKGTVSYTSPLLFISPGPYRSSSSSPCP
jgi:hypothetical protein